MPEPETIAVPGVVGLTQPAAAALLKSVGLTVGTVTTASSATTPAGNVSSANPAPGTPVISGTQVNLEVSSGPAQISVPDVVGFTQPAAAALLKSVGLNVGTVTTASSATTPAGGVDSSVPAAGTLVSPTTAINLEISTGQKTAWSQYLPTVLFALLAVIVLGLIVYGVVQKGGTLLNNLANKEVARGLITFLIAITTVGIAVILAISTIVVGGGVDDDKRFDRGKQVLTMLIGVLGTIVGFYFGSATETRSPQQTITATAPAELKVATATLPDGAAKTPYQAILQTTGGTPPLKWSVKPALPVGLTFDAAKGIITGTPTAPLSKTQYTFAVTDSATPPVSSTADLTLSIK
jgi:PASTA domain-containing protein/putative Ig domain-containing protein